MFTPSLRLENSHLKGNKLESLGRFSVAPSALYVADNKMKRRLCRWPIVFPPGLCNQMLQYLVHFLTTEIVFVALKSLFFFFSAIRYDVRG